MSFYTFSFQMPCQINTEAEDEVFCDVTQLLGIMKRNPLDDNPVEVSKPLILDLYNNTQHFKNKHLYYSTISCTFNYVTMYLLYTVHCKTAMYLFCRILCYSKHHFVATNFFQIGWLVGTVIFWSSSVRFEVCKGDGDRSQWLFIVGRKSTKDLAQSISQLQGEWFT